MLNVTEPTVLGDKQDLRTLCCHLRGSSIKIFKKRQRKRKNEKKKKGARSMIKLVLFDFNNSGRE